MTEHDEVMGIIDRHDGEIHSAAADIYNGPKRLAIYTIGLALQHVKRRTRSQQRRSLRREILGGTDDIAKRHTGFGLSGTAKKKLLANTQKLFGPNGWMIGSIYIADMTREGLIEEALRERRTAGGHITNAQIYETLAAPMLPGQRVRDCWSEPEVDAIKKTITKEWAATL